MSALLVLFLLLPSTMNGLIMPMTTQNGTVDLMSVLNHITLLEQQLESRKDFTTEIQNLKSQLMSTQEVVQQLKTELNHAVEGFQEAMEGSATFTRWGNTTCPDGNAVIYRGYVAGTNWNSKASNANLLCLPDNPIYDKHTSDSHGATIHGAEYQTEVYPSGSDWRKINNQDVPCVVCASNSKRSVIMVPARNKCHQGWDLEYSGYLMGAGDRYASAEFICVDKDPEFIPGGHDNHNGQSLYYIESSCLPLPCPPYENNWELTCAVCSR